MRNTKQLPLVSSKKYLVYLTVVISLVIIVLGFFYFNYEKNSIRNDKYSELKAISEMKINQLEQWFLERKGDADVAVQSPFLSVIVNSWIKHPLNKNLENDIVNRFNIIKQRYGYEDILLVTPKGKLLLSISGLHVKIDTSTTRFIKKAVSKKSLVLSFLYKCSPHNTVHFDLLSPILNQNKSVIAVLILRVNPYDYLYPLIQSWPTPSKSAETLIVRKENDSVLFLNELRFKKNSAMSFRISLTKKELPAAMGILGKTGIFEGKDYRGVEVISDLQQVPQTPWIMVAKVDRAEIFKELYYRTGMIGLFTFLAILFVGSLSAWRYRSTQNNFYREMYLKEKELRESQQEFRTILYSIGDAVITTDTLGRIKQMNEIGEKLTGWSEEEAKGKLLDDVFKIINEETRKSAENPVHRVLNEGTIVGLANHTILINKNGKEVPITDSGSPIKTENGEMIGVVLVFRDQTEERAANKILIDSETRYRSLFENMLNGFAYCKMIYENDEPSDFIYLAVNDAFEKQTGLKNVVNKKVSEVVPGIREADPELFKIYGRVAKTGFPEYFEMQLEALKMWFSISVYCPKPEYFVAVFDVITERKLAEKVLKESEERFRRSFEFAAIGKSITGLDGKMSNINNSLCKMLGYTKEELTAKSFLSITHPDDVASSKKIVEGLLNNERESYRVEKRYVKKDGSILWADVSTMLLRDVDGKPQYFVTHVMDITGSKLSKQLLIESEKKYRYLFENNPEPMWIYDMETLAFLEVNEAAIKHYGYSKQEFMKMTLMDIRPEEDIPALLSDVAHTTNEYNFAGEWRHKKKNGEMFFVEIISHLIEFENKPARLVLIRDVTERKQAEHEIIKLNSELENKIEKRTNELKDSLNLIETMVESSSTGLSVYDHTGQCIMANKSTVAIIGATKEAVLKQNYHGIESWRKSGLYETAGEALVANEPRQIDAHLFTTFGKEVWIDCVFVPFISGNQIHLLLIMHDISGRVKREEKINHLNEELKAQTERLIAANKELEAFSYSVSHDLRAPLRAIDGFTGMLVESYSGKFDDEGLRICSVIQENAKKMGQLIDDLLAFSRLSRAELNVTQIDMKTMVNSIYYEQTDESMRKKINFVVGDLLPVKGDPNMIRQVWVNLISNAIKFSAKREQPRIEIINYVDMNSIIYFIRDNGAGFSMKYVGKLFGVFQRLHSVKEFEGTGVGLAIVQRIVNKHLGRVWAEGEVDKGASFYFSLPK